MANSEEFDIETTITLTRRKTKETMALIKKDANRYRWISKYS